MTKEKFDAALKSMAIDICERHGVEYQSHWYDWSARQLRVTVLKPIETMTIKGEVSI